ncbi:MAG: hypothetical protein IIV86_03965, partial [Bacteroidaceae bacterium]|nr:hypothetical protein [Bacteroidaceae bacterium]
YYFLTEDKEQVKVQEIESAANNGTALTTFDEHALYENEIVCVGQTGRLYMGEDLVNNNAVTINAPGVDGDKITLYVAVGANSTSSCKISTTCNGTALTPNISVGASDSYSFLKLGNNYYTIDAKENLELTFKTITSGSIKNFYLDYIRLFYPRYLAIDSVPLHFRRNDVEAGYFAIDIKGRNSNNIRVWDVTNVNKPAIQKTSVVDNKVAFTPTSDNEYVAFDITQALATPQFVCKVENQNLHGIDYIPDMVIVTTRTFIKEAERIAQLHRDNDNMKVLVCEQLAVFNEFSAGNPDATAIRRM